MLQEDKDVWTAEEDAELRAQVEFHGLRKWVSVAYSISEQFNTKRTVKQCRARWYTSINTRSNHGRWTICEEDMIFGYVRQHGNQWSKLAKLLPGRSENAIKNYFYSTVRKNIRKLNKMLIFPEKIQGSAHDLIQDPNLVDLIFCNSKKSLELGKELRQQLNSEVKMKERPVLIKLAAERRGETETIVNANAIMSENIKMWEENMMNSINLFQQFLGVLY